MGKKMLPVDGEKLRELLIKEVGSISEAGRAVGQSEKFFGNFIRKGEIPEYATFLAEGVLGIAYDSYAPEDPVTESVKEDGCDWCKTLKIVEPEAWRMVRYCPKCGTML